MSVVARMICSTNDGIGLDLCVAARRDKNSNKKEDERTQKVDRDPGFLIANVL